MNRRRKTDRPKVTGQPPEMVGSHDDNAHGDLRVDPPPWGRRRRDRMPLLTLAVLSFANIAGGLYLALTPNREFERNPVWHGALDLIPMRDPTVLGVALLMAGIVLPFTFNRRTHLSIPGIFGLALGAGAHGLLAGSFVYTAITHSALGLYVAVAAVAFCVQHLGVLYLERR